MAVIAKWLGNADAATTARLTAYRVGPRLINVDLAELDRLQQPVGAPAA